MQKLETQSSELKQTLNSWKDQHVRTLLPFIPRWLHPNLITGFRFLLIFPFVLFLTQQWFLPALLVFVVGIISDALDGSLARLRKQESTFGMIFDPVSDRLFILVPFLLFGYWFFPQNSIIPVLVASELLILLAPLKPIAERLNRNRKTYRANVFGKLKMIVESGGISLLLITQHPLATTLSLTLFWIAVALNTLSVLAIIATFLPKKEKNS